MTVHTIAQLILYAGFFAAGALFGQMHTNGDFNFKGFRMPKPTQYYVVYDGNTREDFSNKERAARFARISSGRLFERLNIEPTPTGGWVWENVQLS